MSIDRVLVNSSRDKDEPEWECPGVSLHPARRVVNYEHLDWSAWPLGEFRVLLHTCACTAVTYELVTVGGIYQIHRIVQLRPPEHAFAGRWTHREARDRWQRLLLGLAR